MRTTFGNLWNLPATHRVITTNGIIRNNGAAVMGKGIALQARTRYPGIDSELGRLVSRYGNHVFILSHGLVSFPTKHHWKDPLDPRLIRRSASELGETFCNNPEATVLLPPPGCGNGGLTWDVVKPILSPILDDRFTVVLTLPAKGGFFLFSG